MVDFLRDINAKSPWAGGDTLLHVATRFQRPKLISLLLSNGADLEATNEDGCTPFLLACKHVPKMVPFLLAKGANINADNGVALAYAAGCGDMEVVQLLLDRGFDPSRETDSHDPPLIHALWSENEEVALKLLALGVPVDWKYFDRGTALHVAAGTEAVGVIPELVRRGLDLNAKAAIAGTPLHKVSTSPSTTDRTNHSA
jgi:ankyrin repeat protein